MEIRCSRFSLRSWRPGDEESLVRYANNPKIAVNLRDEFPYPYTLADAEAWLNRADPALDFAIEVAGTAVGGIGLRLSQDAFRRSAEIGFWLGEPFWGWGIMTEALRTIANYAFAAFDLAQLYAGVFEWNPASARVLEKAGFVFEGRMRRAVTKRGRTGDQLLYALVRES